ncbi:transposase [Roseinatronobacter bogoriensis subsp. barguzinensis]|uniref:hypothetical protein n=1 Tax=Roseinatronobacter bogoriensis TaxID=119542 RepID=UPI0010EE559F|nr:hypothetical protein [Rhodobaca barguzinensis]MBB4209730.1 transposase [Rhodobaca bogoriensis DSM 18756]TDW33718.1 transposase [Rhodobaca barguzinensis]TDY66189.1 hypothetical protein EV660_11342 [Rhodobaca bogoriensis DSM 18756]
MATKNAEAENAVQDIRRATRKIHSTEEKIRIVLAALLDEGIAQSVHFSWS